MKFLPDLTMPPEPVRPATPWTLGHLRPGLLWTAGLLVVGCAIAALVADWRAVLGVAVGLVIVAAFFSFGSWAVARIGARDDRLTFPAALGSYLIKISLLGVILMLIPHDGPIDVKAMAIAVVAGTIVWSASQISHVLRQRLYYVDYHPPAPNSPAPNPPTAYPSTADTPEHTPEEGATPTDGR